MATVKICDKCGERGATSKLILSYDEQHSANNNVYVERRKRTFDLCDKCAMNIALTIDEFADAEVLDDCSEEGF